MPPLPDELEPCYGDAYRAVRAALNAPGGDDLPRSLRQFVLTPHEIAVLEALERLLAARYDAWQPAHVYEGLAPPSVASLAHYRQRAAASPDVLRWSLLLHDVAKQRGLDGPHPEHCARVAERILAHAGRWSAAEKAQIVWLIRYHDVLGNIYCGERAPAFLREMCRELDAAESARRLQLLQVVMLCDLRGTWQGALSSEEKARFWLDLSRPEQILRRQADLFAWRLQRWSGSLAGVPDAEAEQALRNALFAGASTAERRRLETVFGQRIAYIVYGFYLFTALPPHLLATLLRHIARALDGLARDNWCLVFDTVYRPRELLDTAAEREAAEQALRHYTEQLQQGRLALYVEMADAVRPAPTIHVR